MFLCLKAILLPLLLLMTGNAILLLALGKKKSRLLADLPLITNRDKELMSKFLNDRSTPEQENLTSQYLSTRERIILIGRRYES